MKDVTVGACAEKVDHMRELTSADTCKYYCISFLCLLFLSFDYSFVCLNDCFSNNALMVMMYSYGRRVDLLVLFFLTVLIMNLTLMGNELLWESMWSFETHE